MLRSLKLQMSLVYKYVRDPNKFTFDLRGGMENKSGDINVITLRRNKNLNLNGKRIIYIISEFISEGAPIIYRQEMTPTPFDAALNEMET